MATAVMAATISVRALDPITWEPLQGNGQSCFIYNLAAVAQILAQRLKLFEGEWWEDLGDGLPLFQSILGAAGGQRNLQVVIELISQRITQTVFVTGISSLTAAYKGRKLTFACTVETQFGSVSLGIPSSAAL
jgi:hypothetical protein